MAKGNNVLSTGEIARICNVSQKTVANWFDKGVIHGYRLPGSNDRRVSIEDFLDFIKINNMPSSYLKKLEALKPKK